MSDGEGYRRGTVLGLTIAEVFILLVFLIMLALVGLNRYWDDRLDRTEEWRELMAAYTPEAVQLALQDPDSLRQEAQRLQKQIEALEAEKEQLQRRVRILEGREGRTGEELDRTKQQLEETLHALDEVEQQNRELANDVRMMTKGITPPCWYQRVETRRPLTKLGWRERPYYLFDIAIRDDHMEVQPLPVPRGRATDDGGRPYEREAEDLHLDTIPYGQPLSDREIRDAMLPLFERARDAQVRTYSCTFYVRVWDETAAAAKGRWQQAHDEMLERLFGTYRVRETAWEERHLMPANVPMTPSGNE